VRRDNLRDRDVPGRKPGGTTLPLFEAGAVARSFDTPGFRGMTFHEVRARTIINRVPPASRMAFRWTINPYRGCSHACAYCLGGETRILMADGRTKALAEVYVGDAIYGTVRQGSYRRYVITEVLAHWSTIKSAYRVALEDGTRLICSGDHRFLTGRGWKHVTGMGQGAARRPHLTTNDKLMGVGAFAEPPKESADYRRGGLKEALRFFHTMDPAITRKRTIAGTAIKGDARLGVVSVEPLGLDLPMFDITTGTGDFIANGVVSHNCFARNTHTYLDLDSGIDFNSQIVVKVNAAELARRELAAPRWPGELVAMGTNVDCYQRAEGRYRLMPGIIAALRDAANPFSILTKGTLILRDLDLLAGAAEVTDVGLNVSVGFTDPELWRSVEPGTPSPERRLEACAAIIGRGLRCGVLMGPVLPFLTDSPGQLAATVRQIAAAGPAHVSPIVLHLRPGAREWYLRWLGEQHPELVPRYRELYGTGAYPPRAYQRRIVEQVRQLAERHGVGRASPASAGRLPRAAGAAAGGAGQGGHQAVAAGRQPARVTREVQLSLL
jgi:DNA repair photolyase